MPNRAASWTFIGRALRSRNYRLFFSGQSISLIGTWMTRLATAISTMPSVSPGRCLMRNSGVSHSGPLSMMVR